MNLSRQWIVRLVLVAVMVSSCGDRDGGNPEVYLVEDGGNPEVYLVEDGDNSYHLQWAEPLEEERIVLIETTGAKFVSSGVVVERERQLLIFPAGVIRSNRLEGAQVGIIRSREGGRVGVIRSRVILRAGLSVEILPGEERFNVDLPKKAFHAMGAGDKQLPIGHPFEPYNVIGPSKLIFNDLEKLKAEIEAEIEADEADEERRKADCGPPDATTVTVDPPPGATVPSNQQFRLDLDQGVEAVTVNGTAATGAGLNWTVSPALAQGSATLNVWWTNRCFSTGSKVVGPYTVKDPD